MMFRITLTLVFVFVLTAATAQAQTVRHVAPDGVNVGDCSNENNPCATIQYALNQAEDSDSVRLAPGTYSETLAISKSVNIEGAGAEATILQPPPGLEIQVALIHPSAGQPHAVSLSSLTIRNGVAHVAQGHRGGGIYNAGNDLALKNVILHGNVAGQQGGAIYNDGGSLVAVNLLCTEAEAVEGGSCIYNLGSEAIIVNATFVDNGANHITVVQDGGELLIANSVLWGSTSIAAGREVQLENEAEVQVRYSLVEHPCSWITGAVCEQVDTPEQMHFQDGDAGDFRPRRIPFDSPMVVAGDPATDPTRFPSDGSGQALDLDGKPRFRNGNIDIGAWEHPGFEPGPGNVLHVRIGAPATGNQSGDSWNNAMTGSTGLADALRWAHLNRDQGVFDSTTPLQIWVGNPSDQFPYMPFYDPSTDAYVAGNSSRRAFLMVRDVQLYGGFFGNETSLEQRDPLERRIALVTGSTQRDHIVIAAGPMGAARLDGFTVTGGSATNISGADITVNGMNISHVDGGGVYIVGGSPVLAHLDIVSNQAFSRGGGLFIADGSPLLVNARVQGNQSQIGGGILIEGGSPVLRNVLISGNVASDGGGMGVYAGAEPQLVNSTLSGNNAGMGGGLFAQSSTPTLNNSIVWGNNGDLAAHEIYNASTNRTVSLRSSLSADRGADLFGNVDFDVRSLTEDPVFNDPENGEFDLQTESPAINAGNNMLYDGSGGDLAQDRDLAGNPRLASTSIDMGAYEFPVPLSPFITTWKTDNPGASTDTQITIPTVGAGYDYDVYWEHLDQAELNGNLIGVTSSSGLTIEFPVAGTYQVEITGDFPRIRFSGTGDRQKLLTIEQWGNIQWDSMLSAFQGATNLQVFATDVPDLSQVTSMYRMLQSATSLNADLSGWDVSNVTDMRYLFNGASSFDRSLGDWSIGQVTQMQDMLSLSGLSTDHYDATLIGWAGQSPGLINDVELGASGLTFCLAEDERQLLIDSHGWQIEGDEPAACEAQDRIFQDRFESGM